MTVSGNNSNNVLVTNNLMWICEMNDSSVTGGNRGELGIFS